MDLLIKRILQLAKEYYSDNDDLTIDRIEKNGKNQTRSKNVGSE